jgi:signal transduction histidine kinase/ligand-binding sensor domain-containing protein
MWKWSLNAFSTFRDERRARSVAWWGVVAAVLFCAAQSATALDRSRGLPQYIRDEWGPSKGYNGGPVYGFAQGADGFLWIASARGLIRFDGLKFDPINLPQTVAPGGPAVVGVAATDRGAIWTRVGAYSLLSYRDGVFDDLITSNSLSRGVVGVMAAQRNGSILLSSYGVGVVRFQNGRFDTLVKPDAMPKTLLMSIAETDRYIWLGTRDAGLFRFDGKRLERIEAVPDEKINALLPGDNGDLWIGTDHGMVRWTPNGVVKVSLPKELGAIPALALVRDHDGNIWVAAGAQGLVRVNASGVSWFHDWNARVRGVVTALFQDREGNLWIGTSRGVERLRDGVFATYSELSGAGSDRVGPVYVDDTGRTWFGTTEGGLFWLEKDVARPVGVADLPDDVVYSLDGHKDSLWIGRRLGGLTRLQMTGAGIRTTSFGVKDGLAQDSVYVVHASRDGTVWAGTLSGGVSHLVNGAFQTFTVKDGLISDSVTTIGESADGTMWFGSPQGLSTLSKGLWRTYTTRDGLPSDDINSVLVGRDGDVWVATAAGLAVLRERANRFVAVARLSEPVIGLAHDRVGALWCSTPGRLVRLLRSAPDTVDAPDAESIREYDALDGLLTRDSIKRQRTLTVDSQGRVWYASTNGLAVADPSRFVKPDPPGVLTIQEVAADDTVRRASENLAFPASRRISISFVGVSLTVPERVRYRYRLDGFDSGWSRPSPEHTAVYTNLGPGSYVFRVMASDSTGEWTGGERTVSFELKPAMWQTTWFRVAMVVLLAGALAAAYQLRTAQLTRELSLRFDERLAERTRIAQELHDTLIQGFLGASMHLQVVASQVPDDSTAKGQLSYVLDLMKRVINEGRQAIRGLRSHVRNVDDLPLALTHVARELGITDATACHVIVEGRPQPIHPLIRDEVYRIGREALANAIRHASASLIEVEFDYRPDRLVFVVRDDGIGIDDQLAYLGRDGHWGLSGMRERAEAVGGRLRVRSRAAAGTEVELSIPAAVAFRDDKQPIAHGSS